MEKVQIQLPIMRNPWKCKEFSDLRSFEDHAQFYTRRPEYMHAFDFLFNCPEVVPFNAIKNHSPGDDVLDDIHICLEHLKNIASDVIAVDVTTSDIESIGYKVVRVIIPELLQLHGDYRFPFLGNPRLYVLPRDPNLIQSLRAVPSGGALFPLEIYVVLFNVRDIEMGLFHYNVNDHALETLQKGDFKDKVKDIFMVENIKMENAGMLFILSTRFELTLFKYQNRGYRFILFEAGHVAEHFSLMAAAMGMGSVLVGGFLDDEVNQFLGIDGKTETALYAGVIGKL